MNGLVGRWAPTVIDIDRLVFFVTTSPQTNGEMDDAGLAGGIVPRPLFGMPCLAADLLDGLVEDAGPIPTQIAADSVAVCIEAFAKVRVPRG